jgi:hypothetical protein
MSEWSALVTALQHAGTPPITQQQIQDVLAALPGADKWIQYPSASGRGHGFETRFWWEAPDPSDAATAGADAVERYMEAVAAAGVTEIEVAFVHVTSPGERLTEGPLGLDRRLGAQDAARTWHVMQRSISTPESRDRTFLSEQLDELLERLGPDSTGHARDGMVEVRFWVDASDAIDASAVGSELFRKAMTEIGRPDWRTVRDQATSVAEAARLAYLGVERRALAADPASLPVRLHPALR